MSKYSSDSDSHSEKYYKKSHARRSRERSYSSDSSSSKTKRRKDKKYRRDRSKSRGSDKYSSSRKDRSSSRHRTKSYYSSKSSRYSHSPERSKKRSPSRDRYRSKHKRSKSRERSSKRSRSTSRNRYRRSKKSVSRDRKEKSPSTSSSSSSSVEIKNIKVKETNLEKAMKAAEIAKKKLMTSEPVREEINLTVLDEINDDSFAPKPFVSKAKKSDHIVIDLKAQTIKMPDVEITEPDSIFHPNLFQNEEARTEKWVKELFTYRQKAINGELLNV